LVSILGNQENHRKGETDKILTESKRALMLRMRTKFQVEENARTSS
jgi:hypothetical protein